MDVGSEGKSRGQLRGLARRGAVLTRNPPAAADFFYEVERTVYESQQPRAHLHSRHEGGRNNGPIEILKQQKNDLIDMKTCLGGDSGFNGRADNLPTSHSFHISAPFPQGHFMSVQKSEGTLQQTCQIS